MKNSHRHGVGANHRKYPSKSTVEQERKARARARRAPAIEAFRAALAKGNE